MSPRPSARALLAAAATLLLLPPSDAFAFAPARHRPAASLSSASSAFAPRRCAGAGRAVRRRRGGGASVAMFLGNDGGIFGVGAPEIAVVVLIGYFVLGPQELYKLTKEIGSLVTQFRESGAQATAALTESLEDDFQVNEIRKATDELTGAFSFRRSINYDDTMADAAEEVGVVAAAKQAVEERQQEEGAPAPVKKKKIRRRIKKKVEPEPAVEESAVEDDGLLYTPDAPSTDDDDVYPPYASTYEENLPMPPWDTADEAAPRDTMDPPSADDDDGLEALKARRRARLEAGLAASEPTPDASSRFAQQMSGNWNDQVMDNEDALSPLATLMERLALLEEEREAIQRRLEEEFRERAGVDEEFYRKKRKVLEGAAAEVQMGAYGEALKNNGEAGTDAAPEDTSWWGGEDSAAAKGRTEPVDRVGSGSYLDSL